MDKRIDLIINNLKEVYDPEIPVNVYDLGLIYNVDVDKDNVNILMTLTAISLIAIYGASPLLVSYRDGTDLLIKQVIWVVISIVSLIILIQIGVDRLFTAIDVAYWILIGLLILLIVDKYINLP